MARLAALGRVHSDGGRRRPVASAGNSIPVSAPNPKSRSVTYCSSGVSRAANFAMAMLLETRMASASVSEGWGSSSVIVRPGTRHLPPSPDTWSVGDTRRSASRAAAAKIFARDPGSNVSVNALGRALPSRWREARASTSPVPGSSITTSPPSASIRRRASSSARCAISCSSASSVSTTSSPGTGGAITRAGDSYSRPARSFSTTAAPAWPGTRRQAEPATDARAVRCRVAQLVGRDAHVVGLLGHGERCAVAVVQRAAARLQHDPLGTLCLRLLRPAATVEDLHLHRASHEQSQAHEHPEFHYLDADRGPRHSLARPAGSRDQDDLAVARQVQTEPRLGARDEHGPALGGADAALEIGAVPVEVGAPAAQIAELAGRADGGGLAGVYQPRGHKERHEPEGDPVTAFSSRHRPPSPRRRGAAPSGPAGSRAPRRALAGSACA